MMPDDGRYEMQQVVLGDNTNPLPTASDFERSLSTMADVKPTVTFYVEGLRGVTEVLPEGLAIHSM